jgi:hypothetical protein
MQLPFILIIFLNSQGFPSQSRRFYRSQSKYHFIRINYRLKTDQRNSFLYFLYFYVFAKFDTKIFFDGAKFSNPLDVFADSFAQRKDIRPAFESGYEVVEDQIPPAIIQFVCASDQNLFLIAQRIQEMVQILLCRGRFEFLISRFAHVRRFHNGMASERPALLQKVKIPSPQGVF